MWEKREEKGLWQPLRGNMRTGETGLYSSCQDEKKQKKQITERFPVTETDGEEGSSRNKLNNWENSFSVVSS